MNKALDDGEIEWGRHALERIAECGISTVHTIATIRDGEVVENYPDAFPYPAARFLAWSAGTPLHVVAGFDVISRTVFVITVYIPDERHFENDMRTR